MSEREQGPSAEQVLSAAIEAQSRQLERQGRYERSLLRMREQDAATVTEVRSSNQR